MENYVSQCLRRNPRLTFDNWRNTHLCCKYHILIECYLIFIMQILLTVADCPRGQVYKDCYLRKCEQNCENIRHGENCYLTMQDVCFPGCYCPEGLVKDGNSCVEPNKCKNCNCKIGKAKTLTMFDGDELKLQKGKIYTILKVQDVDIVMETAENYQKIKSLTIKVGTTSLLMTIDPQSSKV